MTPDELRALAAVMRELGVFKLTLPDGVCLEMSQAAILAGQSEALSRAAPAPASAIASPTDPAPDAKPDDDPFLYAATEGLPE